LLAQACSPLLEERTEHAIETEGARHHAGRPICSAFNFATFFSISIRENPAAAWEHWDVFIVLGWPPQPKVRPAIVRIAQIAPWPRAFLPRLYGGTERVVAWLVDELVSLGHEATLLAS
jgi:hypothetical protein